MMWKKDLFSGSVILFLALAVAYASWQMPFGQMANPGPGFTPFWSAVLLGVFSCLALLRALRQRQAPSTVPSPPESVLLEKRSRSIGVILVLCGYALIIAHLGYILTTSLLLITLLRILEYRNWWKTGLIALLTTLASFVLFDYWLQVPLPRGVLGW